MQNVFLDNQVALSGMVMNQSSPATGVMVMYSIDCTPGVVTTDSQGRYSFNAPVDSDVRILLDDQAMSVTPVSYMFTVAAARNDLNFVLSPNVPTSYAISGHLSGLANNAGIQVLYTINGQSGSTSTDSMGNYTFNAAVGANVVVTPSDQSGYTASPTSYQINGVSGNVCGQSFVYSGGSTLYTVRGTISGLPSAANIRVQYTINGVVGSTQTDALGNYTISAPAGATVNIIPTVITGFTVLPANHLITNLSGNMTGRSFVYSDSSTNYTVSGTVSGLAVVSNVQVNYTVNGVTSTTMTDANGHYAFSVPSGATVRIVPSAQSGYSVLPVIYQLSNVSGNVPAQNFVYSGGSTLYTVRGTISGLPSAANIRVQYTINGVVGSTQTDALGNYTISAPAGATINIIPTAISGFTVLPANHLITNLSGNMTGRSFVYSGSGVSYTIRGTLYGLPCNVNQTVMYTINGVSGSVITDDMGGYTITAPAGANVMITPQGRTGYSASPGNYNIANLTGNLLNHNFVFSAIS